MSMSTAKTSSLTRMTCLQQICRRSGSASASKEKFKKEDVSSVAELNLDQVPEEFRERLKEVLRSHKSMWSGSLGQINAAEHQIEFKPGTRPIRQHPYRVGLRAREIKATEVD
eukprot:IDg19069t1